MYPPLAMMMMTMMILYEKANPTPAGSVFIPAVRPPFKGTFEIRSLVLFILMPARDMVEELPFVPSRPRLTSF